MSPSMPADTTAIAAKTMPANNTYMVGWITANGDQTMAAEDFFDQMYQLSERKAPGDTNQYTLGKMGKHNVVLAEMPAREKSTSVSVAAKTVSDMMRTFVQIRAVLFVGTGSGVYSDEHRIRLGDVVVSHYGVFQYNDDTTVQSKTFRGTGKSVYAPDSIRTAVKSLTRRYLSATNPLGTAVDYMINNFPSQKKYNMFGRPDEQFDRLYKPEFPHRKPLSKPCHLVCGDDGDNLEDRPPLGKDEDSPAVHLGLVASANRSIRDPNIRDQLVEEEEVLCFETEAAGFMSHLPCLMIRGITDYADTHSSSKWHGYAAVAASAYARHILHALNPDQIKNEEPLRNYAQPNPPTGATTEPVNTQPPVAPQSSGDTQITPRVQAASYTELVGHFLKSEVDAAIIRNRKGFQADLLRLVEATAQINGEKWKPVGHKLEEFHRKWKITRPSLREGKKATQGIKFEDWQKVRHNGKLSKQTRFFAAHNELLALANGTVFDGEVGYGSLQCHLWSVWRTMEYMGIAEEIRL